MRVAVLEDNATNVATLQTLFEQHGIDAKFFKSIHALNAHCSREKKESNTKPFQVIVSRNGIPRKAAGSPARNNGARYFKEIKNDKHKPKGLDNRTICIIWTSQQDNVDSTLVGYINEVVPKGRPHLIPNIIQGTYTL